MAGKAGVSDDSISDQEDQGVAREIGGAGSRQTSTVSIVARDDRKRRKSGQKRTCSVECNGQ